MSETDQIENAVFNRISREVDKLHREKWAAFERFIKAFGLALAAVIGTVSWFGFGELNSIEAAVLNKMDTEFENRISKAVKDAVDLEIGDGIAQIDREQREFTAVIQLNRLAQVAETIRDGDRFAPDQMDQALNLLEEVKTGLNAGELPLADAALGKIAEALFQAGQWRELVKVESWFPEVFLESPELRNLMLQAYTIRSFRPSAPGNLRESAKRYAQAAWDDGWGESALAEELMFLYDENPDLASRGTQGSLMLSQAEDFTQPELLHFLNAFGANLDVNLLSNDPKAAQDAIIRVGWLFFENHWKQIDELFSDDILEWVEQAPRRGENIAGILLLLETLDEKAG